MMERWILPALLLLNSPRQVVCQPGGGVAAATRLGQAVGGGGLATATRLGQAVGAGQGGLASIGNAVASAFGVTGAYGQDCTPSPGDFPKSCPTVGELNIGSGGKIECVHNFDCCKCGIMRCGEKVGIKKCKDVICNGDSSCYGVKGIEIWGPESGSDFNCNGDLSCMGTKVRGENVKGILCSGDGSCAYSDLEVTCVPGGCEMRCAGDNSCESHPTDLSKAGRYILTNSFGLSCAVDGCKFSTFSMLTNLGGSVSCGADRACFGAKVTINNIRSVQCNGISSCENATLLLINPQNEFSLECNSMRACFGLRVEIIVTDPTIARFRSISCGGAQSCEGLTASITKLLAGGAASSAAGATNGLEIREFACNAQRACFGAVFDLGANVVMQSCGCAGGMTQACEKMLGVESCMHGLEKMECTGTGCQGKFEIVTNPSNYFHLICSDPGSCDGFVLQININTAPSAPTRLGGVICGSTAACRGLRVFVFNTGANRVSMQKVTCGASRSCSGAAFVLAKTDIIDPITCGTTDSCETCSVFVDTKWQACDTYAKAV